MKIDRIRDLMQKNTPLCCSVTGSRSEKELQERLKKKKFSEQDIAVTLRHLKQAGHLDDHALARDLKRQAFDNKLLGHNRAKMFLLDRGVPDEINQ